MLAAWPAVRAIDPVRVVGPWLNQLLMTVWPLTMSRLPSSLFSENWYVPVVGGRSVPVHLADQLVPATPPTGDCPPQTKSTDWSTRLATTVPESVVLP